MIHSISLNYLPRKWQAEFHAAKKNRNLLIVHRRGGKTVVARMELVHEALSNKNHRYAYVAPYLKQARKIMWDELKLLADKIPGVLIRETDMSITFPNGSSIELFGADNAESIRGLGFNGIILDEFASFANGVFGQVILPTLASADGWLLIIGTMSGIDPLTEMYAAKRLDPAWYTRVLNVDDTGVIPPHVLADQKATMLDREWQLEWMCNLDVGTEAALIPGIFVDNAIIRRLQPRDYNRHAKILGCDIARFGDDSTVLFPRQGPMLFPPIKLQGASSIEVAQRIVRAYVELDMDAIFLDSTGGFGGGVADQIRHLGYECTEVHFNGKADNPERYKNKRTEMWVRLAMAFKTDSLQLPVIQGLKAELCTPEYWLKGDMIEVQPKDEVKKILKRSPDLADALALTYYAEYVEPIRDKWGNRAEAPMQLKDWDPLG